MQHPVQTPIIQIDPIQPEPEKIARAAATITRGGVIAYPTETVYGLGASIWEPAAIDRIYRIKGRDLKKALIVIIPSLRKLTGLVVEIPARAQELMHAFWPGPLTLVFKAAAGVPVAVCGQGVTIAIRIPANQICLDLLNRCDCPLTSTSANLAGTPTPADATTVAQQLGAKLDLIIDGGPSSKGIPSTVLDVTTAQPRLIRAGLIPLETLERITSIEY
jgi:L-threonylcarbamoyladenylate synthase